MARATYFGAIIGRYANRIANHTFSLNGKKYTLNADNGVNTLHGGYLGWNTQVWPPTEVYNAVNESGSSGDRHQPHQPHLLQLRW